MPCWKLAVSWPPKVVELLDDDRQDELLLDRQEDDELRLDEQELDERQELEDELDDRLEQLLLDESTATSPPPKSSMTVPASLVWIARWPAWLYVASVTEKSSVQDPAGC